MHANVEDRPAPSLEPPLPTAADWTEFQLEVERYCRALGFEFHCEETREDLKQFDALMREMRREDRRGVSA